MAKTGCVRGVEEYKTPRDTGNEKREKQSMSHYLDRGTGEFVADPTGGSLGKETVDLLEKIAKEVWEIIKLLILCTLELVVRLINVIPTLILILVVAYAIIVLRFGVVWAAFILNEMLKNIFSVINSVMSIGSFFGGGSHSIRPRDIVGSWIDVVTSIPKTCRQFVTWQDEVFFFARLLTYDNLCPVVRYVYPVPWLYAIFDGLFGLFIFDPVPSGGNCKRPAAGWLCWALGLGFFLKDFLIAFLLVLQVLAAYLPLLKEFYKVGKSFLAILKGETEGAARKGRATVHRWMKRKRQKRDGVFS